MSSTTTNLLDVTKKQYVFKLKANIDSYSSLIGIQMLALFFSSGGVGSFGSGSDWIDINVRYYSSDMVIVFTMLWSFVTAITITTKAYRNYDFTFVTNRLSSSLSNILFLLTMSVLGAVTSLLSGYLLQVIHFVTSSEDIYMSGVVGGELLLGIFIAFLYIFCVSALGYLIGALVQVSRLFIIVIPALIIGSLFVDASMQRDPMISDFIKFYIQESSIGLFMIKIAVTAALLFVASISILNRMEANR